MAQFVQNSPSLGRYSQLLLALSLSVFSLTKAILPALAEGTQAGTSIRNAATATYIDPSNPDISISTISNEVVVTVAEIAGITVNDAGHFLNNDADNSGTFTAGDQVYFLYTVTNVGNDPTQFRIPNQAFIGGPAIATTGESLEFSEDGGTTWIEISGPEVLTGARPPGASVQVRVSVTLLSNANPGDNVTVRLGNTTANAQNIERIPEGGDVHTVDGPDGAPNDAEIDGVPINGVREASATQTITIATSPNTYTLATLLKTRSGYNNQETDAIADDQITYGLSLRIESSDPTGNNIAPAPLQGTRLAISGGNPALNPNQNYVLISDAIPAGTDFASIDTLPTGWTAVYTTDDVAALNANQANWNADIPANLANITRVGFVFNTSERGAIALGQTLTGFSFRVDIEDTAVAPLTVANIAQVFGQSPAGAPVYDESGDQSPSNFGSADSPQARPPGTVDRNGDNLPDPGSDLNPDELDDGFINNPATPETGVDTAGDNTGDNPPNQPSAGGEATVFVVQPPQADAVANGPQNAPQATGPSGTSSDDFSNQSVPVPPGTAPGSQLNPSPVSFTNTVTNTGQNLGFVTLEPTSILSNGQAADLSQLPDQTTITLTYDNQSATYQWNANTNTFALVGGATVTIAPLAAGQTESYGVEIDLPNGTPLSTEGVGLDPTAAPIGGFAIPILASLDTTPEAAFDAIQATNTTINRLYTGYLRLVVTAQAEY